MSESGIMNAGRIHSSSKNKAIAINHNIAFYSLDFLVCVKTIDPRSK